MCLIGTSFQSQQGCSLGNTCIFGNIHCGNGTGSPCDFQWFVDRKLPASKLLSAAVCNDNCITICCSVISKSNHAVFSTGRIHSSCHLRARRQCYCYRISCRYPGYSAERNCHFSIQRKHHQRTVTDHDVRKIRTGRYIDLLYTTAD